MVVLQEKKCRECGRSILVDVRGLRNPRATGTSAFRLEQGSGEERFCGYICFECALRLSVERRGCIAGCGVFAADFFYEN